MVISIRKVAKELDIRMPDLIMRTFGRLMYDKIITMLQSISSNEVIVLDFEGIKVIDSSFVDEFFVKIIKNMINGTLDFYIKLKNISKIAEINIDSVFRTYFDYNNKKIVVITEDICQNNNFFIGHLQDIESDVIDYLRVNKSARLSDLSKFTGLDIDKAGEIIEELCNLRLVRHQNENLYEAL